MKLSISLLAASLLALSVGCNNAKDVAMYGAPSRGPAAVSFTLDDSGNLKSFDGQTAGGQSSVVHVARKTWYENGQPKSDTVATSDPTLVQLQYFAGVRGQSAQDASNTSSNINAVVSGIQSLGASIMGWQAQLREQRVDDREYQREREAKQDERFNKLFDLLSKKVGQ